MSFANETAYPTIQRMENRYKSKCPAHIAFNYNRFQPYARDQPQPSPATHEAVSVLSKMNYRVNDSGYYLPSPATPTASFTFQPPAPVNPFHQMNRTLPPTSPLTPSCAYYKSPTPKFVYPEDLLPPTSLFTKSIAGSIMAEETGDDNRVTRPRSHDISSILSLPQDNWDTESYDLFDNVCPIEQKVCYSYNNPYTSEFNHRPADDIALMENQPDHRLSLFDPEYFTKHHPVVPVSKEASTPRPSSKPKAVRSTRVPKPGRPARKGEAKQFKCDFCSKFFAHRSALNVHTRIHTGVRPYSCHVCGKSFTDNSTYVKHLRIHTNEKPYSCDVCCKSFTQSGNLARHKKTHL